MENAYFGPQFGSDWRSLDLCHELRTVSSDSEPRSEENRGPHIAEGDYTPHSAVDIFVKDLGIVCDIGHASKFPLPIAATALQQFIAAAGAGLGREDDSAVAKVYANQSDITLP